MDQTFDRMFYGQCRSLAGVDEVGVTALAGPIVAACVVLPRLTSNDDLSLFLIDDSKRIRERYRYESARIVQEHALAYGIGTVPPNEIDALNASVASNLAMKRAVDDCKKRFGNHSLDFCLIDGNRDIDLDVPHKLIVKGDLKSLSIAAASVLAKVHRDQIMKEFDKLYPDYGFAKHKGYRCDLHYQGLDMNGILIGIHRTRMFPLSSNKEEWKFRKREWIKVTENKLYHGGTSCHLTLT